jgi:hypothetical protein
MQTVGGIPFSEAIVKANWEGCVQSVYQSESNKYEAIATSFSKECAVEVVMSRGPSAI